MPILGPKRASQQVWSKDWQLKQLGLRKMQLRMPLQMLCPVEEVMEVEMEAAVVAEEEGVEEVAAAAFLPKTLQPSILSRTREICISSLSHSRILCQ